MYHTVSMGESLSYLSMLYNTPIEQLVAMNHLGGVNASLQIDQVLRVPVDIKNVAPGAMLLPDSEVVYGPSYVGFKVADFIQSQPGYLATYTEMVDGQQLTSAEIIERIGERFSVGPRLLLALLEYYGSWVTNSAPSDTQLRLPLGPRNPYGRNLYLALGFTANRVNAGYYGYKRDGFWIYRLADRSQAITPSGLNAGSVGVQNLLALHSDAETWQQAIHPDGFVATYRALFGDPATYAVEPLVPKNLKQPPLELPWSKGEGYYFTGGPHPAYADGSGWAAIDFAPPDVLGGCFYSNLPATAAAGGVIVSARQGEVQLDLDGDGHIQTGWGLYYLHVALDLDYPVQAGQRVAPGDVIGYASCEGGLADSSHVHLARRYNGEWIEAGGPVPMELSGWVVEQNLVAYDGTIRKGAEVRESCECWETDVNLIVNPATE
jgi:murein DD-endopeptidase MepM/ murein hydrolase activator NlpD